MAKKIKRNEKFKLDSILKRIEEKHRIQDDGRVAFDAFTIHEARTVLLPMFSFPQQITTHVREGLLSNAIAQSLKSGCFSEETLLSELNSAREKYYARREEEYTVLTSISAKPTEAMQEIELDGCIINFLEGDYPEAFKEARSTVRAHELKEKIHTPEDYCKVMIRTKDRDPYDAFSRCTAVLDVVRGLLCSFMNKAMSFPIGGRGIDSINVVHVGFLHTIHINDGSLAQESYWYEPFIDYVKPIAVDENTARNCLWAIDKLSEFPAAWREILLDTLLRYVKALDERQPDSAFLQVWGALEALVVNGEVNSDNLPRRCAFLWDQVDYHEQVLRSLRENRNMAVHRGWMPHDAKTNCYLVQRYFNAMFIAHLKHHGRFKTYKEMTDYLDLPPDIDRLKERARMIEIAVKYRSPTKSDAETD